jgi:2-polyprenyl-3-methyl-5-hydroxy-6-metoxy-1,4-benzoquinol methylase
VRRLEQVKRKTELETGTGGQLPWQLMMLDKALKKKQKLHALRRHLPDVSGKQCLLITCGDNNGAMNYRIREWGGHWTWAELEEANINEIESLLQDPVAKVDSSNCKLAFADASFDCVVTIDCHEHLTDPTLLNRELCRLTKPGGKVVVTVPNGDHRKLAVRTKHLLGMTKKEYGHVVIGYQVPELRMMLEKAGLRPSASSSYSRFFTEMIELGINFSYVKILAKRGKVKVAEGVIAPTTQDQLKSVAKTFKLYSRVYPLLKAVSQLDALLFFTTGYAVVVEAKRP